MEEEQMMQPQNITEEIGESYKQWQIGQKILITAPTGSGKTFFILHTLLDYAWENNRKIVYFVNRKILKKQLEEELERLDKSKYTTNANPNKKNIYSFIEICTYQSLENHLKENTYRESKYIQKISQFDYLVCDECHYFYCDSNFNTGTMFSFNFLADMFMNKICIYMSATMENIQTYIFQKTNYNRRLQYLYHQVATEEAILQSNEIRKYSFKRDYSYLSIHLFGEKKDICELPDEYEGKWLIFIDNIDEGKNLCHNLNKKYNSKEVVFIDAEYEKSEEAYSTVNALARQKFAPKDILIATNVLDNGVSIHDLGLRNIVIITDNYETFIQMLGRKREDGKRVNLFIPYLSRQFFQQRLNTVICPAKNFIEIFYKEYFRVGLYPNQMGYMIMEGHCQGADMMKLFEYIINNPGIYKSAQKLCCFMYPIQEIYLNQFAEKRIYDFEQYYSRIIDKFDTEGESAFVRVQLEWLGITEQEADDIIREYSIGKGEKERQSLIGIIEEVCGKELLEKDNLEFKGRILENLLFLLKHVSCESSQEKEELQKKISSLKKNDRTISEGNFNYYMSKLDLPYKMTKPSGKKFLIQLVEN